MHVEKSIEQGQSAHRLRSVETFYHGEISERQRINQHHKASACLTKWIHNILLKIC